MPLQNFDVICDGNRIQNYAILTIINLKSTPAAPSGIRDVICRKSAVQLRARCAAFTQPSGSGIGGRQRWESRPRAATAPRTQALFAAAASRATMLLGAELQQVFDVDLLLIENHDLVIDHTATSRLGPIAVVATRWLLRRAARRHLIPPYRYITKE